MTLHSLFWFIIILVFIIKIQILKKIWYWYWNWYRCRKINADSSVLVLMVKSRYNWQLFIKMYKWLNTFEKIK